MTLRTFSVYLHAYLVNGLCFCILGNVKENKFVACLHNLKSFPVRNYMGFKPSSTQCKGGKRSKCVVSLAILDCKHTSNWYLSFYKFTLTKKNVIIKF